MGFDGKRVLALESRRAAETAELIRRNGGEPFVAPSMREIPIEENRAAFDFLERLCAGEFDTVILLTGVGTRFLAKTLGPQFAECLGRVVTVARGPKPSAALRELGLTATVLVPEPNTWREILVSIESRHERRIAVQEYGRPAPELIEALRARGAEVTSVPVYRWALPEDLAPLESAIRHLSDRFFDVSLFTSSAQLDHLFQVAARMSLRDRMAAGLKHSVIGSIGPETTGTLVEFGLPPALEASHPKLGILVKEAGEFER